MTDINEPTRLQLPSRRWPDDATNPSPEWAEARAKVRADAEARAQKEQDEREAARKAADLARFDETVAEISEDLARRGMDKRPSRHISALSFAARDGNAGTVDRLIVEPFGPLSISEAVKLGLFERGLWSDTGYRKALANWQAQGGYG